MSCKQHTQVFPVGISLDGIGAFFHELGCALLAPLREWLERRQLQRELLGLDRRELQDLGLQRCDIDRLAQGHPVAAAERRRPRRRPF